MKKIFIILSLFCSVSLFAQPKMPEVFSNGMILQQQTKVAIWGQAQPNTDVELECSWIDKNLKTRAGSDGNFLFEVATLSAKPIKQHYFIVKDETGEVEFNDVLFGEVWLAGGQSNMAWELSKSDDADKYIAESENENLRFYYAPHYYFEGDKVREKGAWVSANPRTVKRFSAVAYHFAKELQAHLDIPVGVILCYKGGTPAETWMSEKTLKDKGFENVFAWYERKVPENYEEVYQKFLTDNKAYKDAEKRGEKPQGEKPREPDGWRNPKRPVGLYELMLKPLMPYTVKGFLWYQGEANAPRAKEYQTLFPALIEEWRSDFKVKDAPFIFAQLSNYDHPGYKYPAWAQLREAQWLTEKNVNNTAMVVTIDVGNKNDIHPTNKQPVGYRIYLAALGKVYGENVVYKGPEYKTMEVKGSKIILTFENQGQKLDVSDGESLKGFVVCGKDRKFSEAKARIIAPDKIEVWSDNIKSPEAVRYGWANWTDANLINEDGLWATPFRTDHYELDKK